MAEKVKVQAGVARPETLLVPIQIDVDVGSYSTMFCCVVCLELIQSPDNHRQCRECCATICTSCIPQLINKKCPICSKPAQFGINGIIQRDIYPKVSKQCKWQKCGVRLLDVSRHQMICTWRIVQCPVCEGDVVLGEIHIHLSQACNKQWVIQSLKDTFSHIKDAICALSSEGVAIAWNLIPASQRRRDDDHERRVLYIWGGKGLSDPIFAACVQICATEGEVIVIRGPNYSDIILPVLGAACFGRAECIPVGQFIGPGELTLLPDLRYLCAGRRYAIIDVTNRSQSVGVVRDILWGPARVTLYGDKKNAIPIMPHHMIVEACDSSNVVSTPNAISQLNPTGAIFTGRWRSIEDIESEHAVFTLLHFERDSMAGSFIQEATTGNVVTGGNINTSITGICHFRETPVIRQDGALREASSSSNIHI